MTDSAKYGVIFVLFFLIQANNAWIFASLLFGEPAALITVVTMPIVVVVHVSSRRGTHVGNDSRVADVP